MAALLAARPACRAFDGGGEALALPSLLREAGAPSFIEHLALDTGDAGLAPTAALEGMDWDAFTFGAVSFDHRDASDGCDVYIAT